jgi:hypothetical protein
MNRVPTAPAARLASPRAGVPATFPGRSLACLLAIVLALPRASAEPAPPQGSALHRSLEGVWCNSNDNGRTCWAYDTFLDDGTFEACGKTDDDTRPFRATGMASVEGRRMCYVVTTASDNFWLRPGSRYCTDIIAIDERMHRYRDIDTGAEFTLHRRPALERRCP